MVGGGRALWLVATMWIESERMHCRYCIHRVEDSQFLDCSSLWWRSIYTSGDLASAKTEFCLCQKIRA
jgi:hypothetical protein